MLQVLYRIPIHTQWFPDGIPIYGFGMMLFLAFVACTWLAGRRCEREGISKETIQDLAIWVFAGGLLGARITYLLNERPVPGLKDFLLRLPRIWDGGIILYGAALGALASYLLGYYLVFRKRGVNTLRLADVVAPSIALGLCLGRMGCFLNGCCFGQVACAQCAVPVPAVSFPLTAPPREVLVERGYQTAAGFTLRRDGPEVTTEVAEVAPGSEADEKGLKPGAIITGVNGKPVNSVAALNSLLGHLEDWPRGETRLELEFLPQAGAEAETITLHPRTLGLYPTQLYEVISMALLLLVLLAYEPFRRHPGQMIALLLVGYGIHRYLNEILRDDPRPRDFEWLGSAVCVAVGALLWLILQSRPAAAKTLPPEAPPTFAVTPGP